MILPVASHELPVGDGGGVVALVLDRYALDDLVFADCARRRDWQGGVVGYFFWLPRLAG